MSAKTRGRSDRVKLPVPITLTVLACACSGTSTAQNTGYIDKEALRIPESVEVSAVTYADNGVESSDKIQSGKLQADVRQIVYFDFALKLDSLKTVDWGLPNSKRIVVGKDAALVAVDRKGLPTSPSEVSRLHKRHLSDFISQPTSDIMEKETGVFGKQANRESSKYNSEFDQVYFDNITTTEIICSRSSSIVSKGVDTSTCDIRIFLPELKTSARAHIAKSQLVNWRAIRAAVIYTINSFVISRKV